MLKQLVTDLPKSHVHLGSFLLRLGLAIIFIYHGYLKLIQDGGRGWSNSLEPNAQMAVAWGETLCGVALLFGFLSRIAAIGLVVIMVGAITMKTGKYDFVYIGVRFPSDEGSLPTGAEYNFALIMMCLAVVAIGSGKVAIDHCIFGRRRA